MCCVVCIFGRYPEVLLQEFASRGWEPKTQVPYKVDSGSAPRKLEIERRKRHFTKHARDMDKLLRKNGQLINITVEHLIKDKGHLCINPMHQPI